MISLAKSVLRLAAGLSVAFATYLAPLQSAAYAAPGGSKGDEKEINRSVELNAMVFPVFDEDHQLINYLFVNARMLVADGKGVWDYRDKAHIIRDTVLRASHRTSIHLKSNYTRIDEMKAEKLFLDAVNQELGEEAFVSITFLQVASQELQS